MTPSNVTEGFMNEERATILIIDDDRQVRSQLKELLSDEFNCRESVLVGRAQGREVCKSAVS